MELAIIGSGKVAFQLSQALHNAGHSFSFVYARNKKEGTKLAKKLHCYYISDITSTYLQTTDIVIISVTDAAIAEVALEIDTNYRGIVCHTSGATGIKALGKKLKNTGIFYPLYSFENKRKRKLDKVPFLITSPDKKVHKKLQELAGSISHNIYDINDKQRAKLHLAAVFCNNFPNFMMTLCFDILEKHDLDKEILLPIIRQGTANWDKALSKNKQTGPAIRRDVQSMEKHLSQLEDPNITEMYRLISQNIIRFYE